MNEKSNNMLSRISPKKKKYLILIGIYLICLLIGTFANPWSSSPYDIGDTFVEHMEENCPFSINSAQDQYLAVMYDEIYHFERPHNGYIIKLLMKITTFGVEDLVVCYDEVLMDYATDILAVTFPLIMLIKTFVCKRLFKKEKDRVELGEPKKKGFRLLYYRTENIFAEVLADYIAFFSIGAATRLIFVIFAPIVRWAIYQSIWLRVILISIYNMLLSITMPIYKSTQFLIGFFYGIYEKVYCLYSASDIILDRLIVPFILFPLLNLAIVICFELMLRIVMRIYEAVFQLIKNIIKKLTNTIEVKFNGKPKPDQGGQKYENT